MIITLCKKVSEFKALIARFNESLSFFQLLACGNRGQRTIECWRYDVGEEWTYFNSITFNNSQDERGPNDPFVAVSLDIGVLAFSGSISRLLPKGSNSWKSGPNMTTPDQPNSDNKLHFSHGCAVAISGQSLTRDERLDSGLCKKIANLCFRY